MLALTSKMKVISAFSGIGGFDLAAEQAGMQVVACIEKDPQCRKLLAMKFPSALILDDICTAGARNLPACDVLCGGWPCQDLSVAGLRAGLVNGSRSSLFYELTRLIRELRPRYFLGENVPGLLSSDGGRDFARVLGELANCGKADIAWRTLDAQWFGVAQRRRRVFIVADFGGERASEILSLAESLRGHPAPSREARQDVAGTLGGSSQSGGFRTTDLDNNGAIICRDVAHAVCSHAAKGGDPTTDNYVTTHNNTGQGWWNESDVGGTVRTPCGGDSTMSTVVAFSSKDSGGDAGEDIAPTLRAMNYDKSHINGGGQVAIAFKPSHYTRDKDGAPSEVYPPLSADADKGDQEAVVFQPRYFTRDNKTGGAPNELADITNCKKAGDSAPVVAYRTAGNCGPFEQGDKTGVLNTATDPNQNIIVTPAYPLTLRGREGGMEMEVGEADLYNALKAGDGGSSRQQTVLTPGTAVRRLTPRECERLQGFPDDHTASFADSTRYRMLGNAVCVSVVRWIFERLVKT